MTRMFIRFGLPWLIFGSAAYALYWSIWHGESATSFTATEDFAQHPLTAQRPSNPSTAQTGSEPTFSNAVTPINNLVTGPKQRVVAIDGLDKEMSPQEVRAHPEVIGQALAPSPRDLGIAVQSATQQDPLAIASTLQVSLQDRDPKMRYRALAESDALGVTVPAHTLQQMATSDRDSSVRILAMTKFAQDPEMDPAMVKAVAEAGLRDSDVTVNAHAREMLEQLDRASRSNDEAPQLLPGDPTVE